VLNTFTLSDFLKKYKTNEDCLEEIKNIIYSNGVKCKICKKITPHYKIKSKKVYSCQNCGTQVSPLANTIFHKSSTDLLDWFYAIYLITQTRGGLPALELQRMLGCSYKTAWRMGHQIRKLMTDEEKGLLSGDVEVDETFVGGKGFNRIKVDFTERPKEVVMGMVERGGKLRAKHIETTGKWALREQIEKHIDPKARVFTDQFAGYHQLRKLGYSHYSVNHGKFQYRKGDAYTQNIENVWSHLKRGINGVYHHVSKKHLQAYVDEFTFRYNNRKSEDMFALVLNRVVSVRRK